MKKTYKHREKGKRKSKINIYELFKGKYKKPQKYNWDRVGKEIW